MKKQETDFENMSEADYLAEEVGLDDNEIYILSYLKGFNRKNLKKWNKKGLIDFSIPAI